MPPFRNPFSGKRPPVVLADSGNDEDAPPLSPKTEKGAIARKAVGESRASSTISIKPKREETEFKLSGKWQAD